jgi:methylenetetrahydrofolate--tRNA-(uracil-5-)-methyltransferase
MLAGLHAARLAQGQPADAVPRGTGLGSLVHYITHARADDFQPANITFDLLLPLEESLRKQIRDKRERHRLQCERALELFDVWWQQQEHLTSLREAAGSPRP